VIGTMSPDGNLRIIHSEGQRMMYCPYRNSPHFCGEWCPLFDDSDKDIGEIQLCNGTRVFMKQQKKRRSDK
jgi:hypothetical protein